MNEERSLSGIRKGSATDVNVNEERSFSGILADVWGGTFFNGLETYETSFLIKGIFCMGHVNP